MTRVIAVVEVEDVAKWEQGFRTHGELFKSQTVKSPIRFASKDNEVAIMFEVEDLGRFMDILESPATAEAMELDGVNRETVRIFVLDHEFAL